MELKSANEDSEDDRNDETHNPSPGGDLVFWLDWILDLSLEFTDWSSLENVVEFQSSVLETAVDDWTITGEFW